jgi:hypothetical protein
MVQVILAKWMDSSTGKMVALFFLRATSLLLAPPSSHLPMVLDPCGLHWGISVMRCRPLSLSRHLA